MSKTAHQVLAVARYHFINYQLRPLIHCFESHCHLILQIAKNKLSAKNYGNHYCHVSLSLSSAVQLINVYFSYNTNYYLGLNQYTKDRQKKV